MEQIKDTATITAYDVQRFKRSKVNGSVSPNGVKYEVKITEYIETPCENCAFAINGKMGNNCPRLISQSNPVCFANNRPDNESVYFRKI